MCLVFWVQFHQRYKLGLIFLLWNPARWISITVSLPFRKERESTLTSQLEGTPVRLRSETLSLPFCLFSPFLYLINNRYTPGSRQTSESLQCVVTICSSSSVTHAPQPANDRRCRLAPCCIIQHSRKPLSGKGGAGPAGVAPPC